MGETITIDPRGFGGPSFGQKALEEAGKRAAISSSEQSAAASRSTQQRERADFILKYGIAPEDVTQAKTIPGDTTKTGEEYLATIKDKGLVNKIRMLSEGRMSWPKGAALRNPAMSELIAAASIYDPSLDEANSATRVATRKDFTSGTSARNLTAINTAVGHLADLRRLALALNNTSFPDVNKFINSIEAKRFGDPRVTNYRAAADAFASELAKTFKGGTPASKEIEEWHSLLSENMSPAQFEGFVNTAAKLLNSRIEAVGDQYNRGMGKSADPVRLLSPHAQELYQTIGKPLDETKTADLLTGPEAGQNITGEDIKGWRFSPDAEARLSSYAKQKDANVEGYAKLMADAAVGEGHVPSAQRQEYEQRIIDDNRDFFKQPPEVRAQAGGIDYSNIDKTASENAGLIAGIAQRVKNAPESAYNLGMSVISPVTDLAKSVASGEREGLYKMVPDILMGNQETIKNADEALKERYGSLAAVNRTSIVDPFGFAADISLPITAGGAALERLPGLVTKYAGMGGAELGRSLSPFNLAPKSVDLLSYLQDKYKNSRFGEGLTKATAETAGFRSGVGGEPLRKGFGAGRSKGRAGKATVASESYTQGMRYPEENIGGTVDLARNALSNFRNQASQKYLDEMAKFGRNPEPLSPDSLRQTMAEMRPANYDAMAKAPHRPADHVAWQQMNDTVEHYLGEAAKNPDLLSPLALDQFKQDLYSIGSKIGGATDRDAARIAGGTYRAVRKMLTDHDPVYADIMKPYANAAQEAAELESGFSIGSTRTKPINREAASRKLLSSMRNNVNTNFGQRAAQLERLSEFDPTGRLVPSLAGQSVSSLYPKGIRGALEAAGATLYGGSHAMAGNPLALLDPTVLGVIAGASPRVAGEAAYGLGRVVGATERVGGKLAGKMGEINYQYPSLVLGTSRAGSYADETEAQRLRDLLSQYAPEASDVPEE